MAAARQARRDARAGRAARAAGKAAAKPRRAPRATRAAVVPRPHTLEPTPPPAHPPQSPAPAPRWSARCPGHVATSCSRHRRGGHVAGQAGVKGATHCQRCCGPAQRRGAPAAANRLQASPGGSSRARMRSVHAAQPRQQLGQGQTCGGARSTARHPALGSAPGRAAASAESSRRALRQEGGTPTGRGHGAGSSMRQHKRRAQSTARSNRWVRLKHVEMDKWNGRQRCDRHAGGGAAAAGCGVLLAAAVLPTAGGT